MSTIPPLRLPDSFVKPYARRQPEWGPLGWITYKRTYSRWTDKTMTRREEWHETVRRVVEGNINLDPRKKTPEIQRELVNEGKEMFDAIFNFAWTPPGRGLWMMGTDYAKKTGDALVNCWGLNIRPMPVDANDPNDPERPSTPFIMAMDMLMKGGGVGFNVEREYINLFPQIKTPVMLYMVCDSHHPNYRELDSVSIPAERTYSLLRVEDSRGGWTSALQTVIDAHFKAARPRHLVIDVSAIREAGAPVKGFGGTAAGPGPLVQMLRELNSLLNGRVGGYLMPVDAVDMMNIIAKCVVSGGIRRCLPAGTLIHTRRGGIPIECVRVGDTVVTPKGNARVSNTFIQGQQATVLINHNYGTFECTANHKIAVFTSLNEYAFKEAQHLVAGDRLVWDNSGYDGRRTQLPSINFPKHLHNTTGKPVIIPELDAGSAWLIGLIQGDGYVHLQDDYKNRKGHVSVSGDSKQDNLFRKALEEFQRYGLNVSRKDVQGENTTKIHCFSADLARYFHRHVKQAKQPLYVPIWIRQGIRAVREGYLVGVFDADGSVDRRRNNTSTLCTTVYKEFAYELKTLYASLGIAVDVKKASVMGLQEGWQEKWNVIPRGFETHNRINVMFANYSQKAPLMSDMKQSHKGHDWSREMAIEQFPKIAHRLPPGTPATVHNVESKTGFVSEYIYPVKVTSVVPSRREVETFDIEVEDIHQFVAEGFVVHNSATLGLGSADDLGFITMKLDKEKLMSHRWASNNSISIDGQFDDFDRIAQGIIENGEPGIVNLELCKRGRLCDEKIDERNELVSITNPCITGDSWIHTVEGPRQSKSLVGVPFIALVNGEEYPSTEMGFWQTGIQDVYEIKTFDGYTIKATSNHLFATIEKGVIDWKEVKHLCVEDKLVLHNHREGKISWPSKDNHEDECIDFLSYPDKDMANSDQKSIAEFERGWVLGGLVGDGCFQPTLDGKSKHACLDFWGEDRYEMFSQAQEYLQRNFVCRSDLKGYDQPLNGDKVRISSVSLAKYAEYYNVLPDNKTPNDLIEKSSSEMQRGFLQGLFDADGSIQGNLAKGFSVRLSQNNEETLRLSQRMLLRFGIKSTLYLNRKEAGANSLPNGRGGYSDYDCQAVHELVISRDSLFYFDKYISFSHQYKQTRILASLASYKRGPYKDIFSSRVIDIIPCGKEKVYDCTIPGQHAFDANGIMTHNCSEIPLVGGVKVPGKNGKTTWYAGEPCNLSDVNPAIVERLGYDMDRILRMATRYTKRITCAKYEWTHSQNVIDHNRRIGVSLGGIYDWILQRGVDHLDELSEDLDAMYAVVQDEDAIFSKALGVPTSVSTTTLKPAGTTALLHNSAAGMHAHQAPYFLRRIRFQQTDPLVELIRECGFHVEDDAYSPNTMVATFPVAAPNADNPNFRSVADLTLEEQFRTQATLQRYWADNSVSATLTFTKQERRRIAPLLKEFRDQVKSTSLLPYTEPGEKTTYVQMPYEPITKERYQEEMKKIVCWPHEMAKKLSETKREEFDIIDQDECAGGACPIR